MHFLLPCFHCILLWKIVVAFWKRAAPDSPVFRQFFAPWTFLLLWLAVDLRVDIKSMLHYFCSISLWTHRKLLKTKCIKCHEIH